MLVFRGVCFHIMFPFIFFWDSATVQLDATFLSGCVFWGKLGNRTQFQVGKWSVILLIFRPNLWSHLISIVCGSVGLHVFRSFTSWSIYESIEPAQRLTLTTTIAMIVSLEVEFKADLCWFNVNYWVMLSHSYSHLGLFICFKMWLTHLMTECDFMPGVSSSTTPSTRARSFFGVLKAFRPNVGKYTIHGFYGWGITLPPLIKFYNFVQSWRKQLPRLWKDQFWLKHDALRKSRWSL